VEEKILVVEDDPSILTGLEDALCAEGYEVSTARDGVEAMEIYRQQGPSLILLDIMIPGKSGYDVCREIRRRDARTPILMLTAKGEEVDKVVGLELGADDYIVKPFGVAELLARIRAALRRAQSRAEPGEGGEEDAGSAPGPRFLELGDLRIDLKTFRGGRGGAGARPGGEIAFSKREISLLSYFRRRPGEVVERATLLAEVWGVRYQGTTRTLDQHIAKLRRKIEADPSHPRHILTVHGAGYRFCP